MDAIPTVVCDTLYSMGLHDQTPSWKIMDSRGRITVSGVNLLRFGVHIDKFGAKLTKLF